jgi:hypothetical protein
MEIVTLRTQLAMVVFASVLMSGCNTKVPHSLLPAREQKLLPTQRRIRRWSRHPPICRTISAKVSTTWLLPSSIFCRHHLNWPRRSSDCNKRSQYHRSGAHCPPYVLTQNVLCAKIIHHGRVVHNLGNTQSGRNNGNHQ